VRLAAAALLVTAVGPAAPLAGMHAQSIPATVRHDADRAWPKTEGAWTEATGEMGALSGNHTMEIDRRRQS
jgi:hypothetical protein